MTRRQVAKSVSSTVPTATMPAAFQAVEPPARFGDHSGHTVPIAFSGDIERVADVAAAGKIAPNRRAALGLDRLRNGGADGARGAGH
jgi:hypothetical protein